MPEGREVFEELTVLENLQMGAYTRKGSQTRDDLKRVYQLFPRLQERQKQLRHLSGGEQQMLAIGPGPDDAPAA